MKTKRRAILFRVGTVILLLAIAGVMMIIGRGHTVYFDNKNIDYNGQTYIAPYKAVVSVGGEQVAKLYNKKREDRGMTTCIGQKISVSFVITQEKGGAEETKDVTFTLPYNIDGIAINLPAYFAGLPEEAYLSVFQPAPEAEEESSGESVDGEIPPVDEFALTEI